jgi:dsDNA-specific endonuclease/ATPase MutS2
MAEEDDDLSFPGDDEAVEIPIDGTLDLHTFSPRDVKDLVPAYLEECLERDITQVRIIHGKGTGVLRRIVHSILEEHPAVVNYRHEGGSGGSWGATVATLAKPRE